MTRDPIPKFAIGPIIRALGGECGDYRTGKQKIRCIDPGHDDQRPSAQVDFSNNRYICYACDFGGDALDLIMRVEGVRLPTAIERAEAIAGGEGPAVRESRPRDTPGLFSKQRARRGDS